MQQKYKDILSNYFPTKTLDDVVEIITRHKIYLKFTRERRSKLGDYRPPSERYPGHRISLNGNLGEWFLYLVFIHELAHLLVWKKYQNRVSPHGKQWKQEFATLLQKDLHRQVLPDNLHAHVSQYALNVTASFASHAQLWKALAEPEQTQPGMFTVENLKVNTIFVASNGKTFKKGEKLRTRYRCLCLNNKRNYLFHPLAMVQTDDHHANPKINSQFNPKTNE